jgi:amino acid adenylation domain-containing protein
VAEHHRLLVEWNDTTAEYPVDRCIHELFEAQVQRTPEATALTHAGAHLSYRELEHRANQLGRYLQSLGVGPEVRVGICMERSLEMVVGLLGILKAGGAYVPLDPRYPRERLRLMVESSGIPVLVTQERVLPELPALSARTVCLDRDWSAIAREQPVRPQARVLPGNLAYVIYTSGSTGSPKGVAIAHGNTVAFLSWASRSFTADELARVLASTSICFDMSVFELFVPLVCGGKVVVAGNALEANGEDGFQNLSLIDTVPSAIAELLHLGTIPAAVRTVNLGGEALAGSLVAGLYEKTRVDRVINLYGPSEDTTFSTFAVLPRKAGQAPPVGRPIDNTRIYITGVDLQPVPVGVAGELYIGGCGLARGYLERGDLTAERFVPNPFGEPGSRLYRTGDLTRYLPDGTIEFLTRLDHQIKLRGFRIEPGEIEAVLEQHSAVGQVVVVVREDRPGEKRLVAYVVPREGDAPEAGELRRFAQAKLPEHMVPAVFMVLERLPLTPNGKLDRRGLPPPEGGRPDLKAYVAPRTPLERQLAEMWAELLQVERIGVHDSFFDLGGHSLTATRLVARLRASLGVDIELRSLFETPSIAGLAEVISRTRPVQAESAGPIRRLPRSTSASRLEDRQTGEK